jgi:NAD+ diphosphatase
MIHEIFPHHINNQFIANTKIEENDFVLHYHENSVLLKMRGDKFELPKKKDFSEISDETKNVFVFTLNDTPCFLIMEDLKKKMHDFIYQDISFFRTAKQKEIAWASMVGLHLANWYSINKFCGKCGAKTQPKTDERAILCPACNTIYFPKISPAVIVAIISNNKILLVRSSNFPGSWYSLIAGYVDVGESLEEALAREVKEEVGLDVKNIRYYKSQPWPLSGSMMIGFIAEADENQTVYIDDKEITEAIWFTRGNLPEHSLNISIAGEMIEKFDKGEL